MAVVAATLQKCGSFYNLDVRGGRESGREPCSQPQTYDNQATEGMLATARISAATGTPRASFKQEKAQTQQQKRQQQQVLCGKAIKVAGNK
jgi:hypothetical protein